MTRNPTRSLRVAFFGNTCNMHYQVAKSLRHESDIDAHVFVDARSDPQQLPESDDPELKGNYPDWIHLGRYITPTTLLAPWTSPLVRELDAFDLAIVSHFGPVFAQFSRKPYVFLPLGADLTVHPFARQFLFLYYPTLALKLGALPMSFWQARGIRRSTEIWSQPFSPMIEALRKLAIPPERLTSSYFPVVIDSARFRRGLETSGPSTEQAAELAARHDFIVFHPSRLMIRDHPQLRRTGNWKRNDLLIDAFAEFTRRHEHSRAVLAIIDRPASQDIDLARQQIAALGLEDRVAWLKPPRPFGYTKEELLPLYSAAHVVADDFGIGWFGSVVLEALAIGSCVLTYVDRTVMSKLYPWHPMLVAQTRDEVVDTLTRLYQDRTFRESQAALGPRWIEEFHSATAVRATYAGRIRQLAGQKND